MFYSARYAVPHVISVVASMLLLAAAWRKPLLARTLFGALFGWAAVVNLHTALTTPRAYLEYAPFSISETYREIILGPFARHIVLVVATIAVCQGLMTLGIVLGDIWARFSLMGAAVFLVDIAPLGVGSGFPSTLLMAAAAGVLLSPSRRSVLAPPLFRAVREAWSRRPPWLFAALLVSACGGPPLPAAPERPASDYPPPAAESPAGESMGADRVPPDDKLRTSPRIGPSGVTPAEGPPHGETPPAPAGGQAPPRR